MKAYLACVTLSALLTLSACGQPAEVDAPKETSGQTAAASDEAPDAPGFEMKPGLYAIGSNGTIYAKTRLNTDFTYVDYNPQNVMVGGGTWEVDGASFCFNPRGDDGEVREPRCWVNGVADDDGGFTTTLSDGSESYEIMPLGE